MLKVTLFSVVDDFFTDFKCLLNLYFTYNNFHISGIKVSKVFEFQLSFYGWGFLMSESREGLEFKRNITPRKGFTKSGDLWGTFLWSFRAKHTTRVTESTIFRLTLSLLNTLRNWVHLLTKISIISHGISLMPCEWPHTTGFEPTYVMNKVKGQNVIYFYQLFWQNTCICVTLTMLVMLVRTILCLLSLAARRLVCKEQLTYVFECFTWIYTWSMIIRMQNLEMLEFCFAS